MPFARFSLRDGVDAATGDDTVRLGVDDARRAAAFRVVVVLLDQQPCLVTGLAAITAAVCPDQVPASLELFAVELELEMAPFVPVLRIADRLPRAAIPDDDGARAVLMRRNDALEGAVLQRMVFDVHREPLLVRVEAWALGDRPAQQHAIELQPEVVMELARRVFLDHEGERFRLASLDASTRLRRCAEITFFAVPFEAHAIWSIQTE